MAENSKIEWCSHTFNPWIGCTKISPACDNCYAAEWDRRYEGGSHWGPHADRRRTKGWAKPLKWDREASALGIRYRVFCASLADVFDNHKSITPEMRADLWELIRKTPNLDWLLLTKRPQNIRKFLPDDWGIGYPNVWLGITVENQEEAEKRIPHLTSIPCIVRFLSMEPLLGPVDLTGIDKNRDYGHGLDVLALGLIHWVITGGESGDHYRSADPNWFRSLRDQCLEADVPFLFKQWEGRTQKEIKALGRELDGVIWDQYPE